MYLQGYIGFT